MRRFSKAPAAVPPPCGKFAARISNHSLLGLVAVPPPPCRRGPAKKKKKEKKEGGTGGSPPVEEKFYAIKLLAKILVINTFTLKAGVT